MVNFILNGLEVQIEKGTTILEAAKFFGFPILTLCHMEGLSPYGACRLCVVEIGEKGNSRLVSSCTHPVTEGLRVRTASARVVRTRKMIVELLLASCPQSKVIQDIASSLDVHQQRFKQEHDDCILCGLCVRMCNEQMVAKAIGFQGRGENRRINTPFDMKSDECRTCGGCIYVCPACQLRCTYTDKDNAICNGCVNISIPCVEKEHFDDMMCYMNPCVACEIVETEIKE